MSQSRHRSCLSVPAAATAKLRKASGLEADEIVIDLEDSVPVALKAEGLANALGALGSWPTPGPAVSVRVNPPRTPWCHIELAELAAAPGPLASVVIPKVEGAGDLAFVERLLDGAEPADRDRRLGVQALIESARGLTRLDEIAGASPRLSALILGYADLGASLGRPAYGAENLDLWLDVQNALVIAARAHELAAMDGPFLGTSDGAPFRAATHRARELGFDGKWAIHPSQIHALNDLFTPSEEEVQRAQAIVDALAGAGAGAVSLDGAMIDEALRKSALRVLARARASCPGSAAPWGRTGA